MPQSRSSLGSKGSQNPYPSHSSPSQHTTPQSSSHHVVENQQTLGQSMKQGFGFGIGSAIANRLINPMSAVAIVHQPGPPPAMAPASSTTPPSKIQENINYKQCIQEGGNQDVCKQQLD